MKIRPHWSLVPLAWLVAYGLRLWVWTLRPIVHADDPEANPNTGTQDGIYAVWHEGMLLTGPHFLRIGGSVYVSKSTDGEILAMVLRAMGWGMVRGSTSRGGAEAVRAGLRVQGNTEKFRLAVTVDGPRGPRREAQAGAVFLAAKSGTPLVPIGISCEGRRAKSWDRMLLPKLFGRLAVRVGRPMLVPPTATGPEREAWRRKLQAELDRLTALAEADLEGRAPPADLAPPEVARQAA